MPLEGELTRLREIREPDLPLFVEMRNDLETQAWSRTLPPDYTIEMIRRRYWDRDFSYHRKDALFIVEVKDTGDVAGMINYADVRDRFEASWGMAIRKEHWGTGVAHDAADTLLRFLFHELGLRVVRLWTQSGNERAVRAFEKLGFEVATRAPEAIFKGGRWVDNICMDVLREEWYALHPDLEDLLDDPFAG